MGGDACVYLRTEEEVNYRAELYGWRIRQYITCIIFDIDNYKENYINNKHKLQLERVRDNIFSIIISKIRKEYDHSYYLTRSDSLVFLISKNSIDKNKDNRKLNKIFEIIMKEIHDNYNFTITIGVGSSFAKIMDIHKSYSEGLIAVKVGRNLSGENSVNFYRDISIYWELTKVSESNYDKDNILGKIINLSENDKNYNTCYYDTLKEIIKNDWNLSKTAESLFIHYNTIKYRFNKIKELLDLDVLNRNEKFKIELGIKLYEVHRLSSDMELIDEG
jgi:purine catabolism regulator